MVNRMGAIRAKLGLRAKLFTVIIAALMISVALVGAFVLANQRRLLEAMVVDSLQAAERVVESKLQGQGRAGPGHFPGRGRHAGDHRRRGCPGSHGHCGYCGGHLWGGPRDAGRGCACTCGRPTTPPWCGARTRRFTAMSRAGAASSMPAARAGPSGALTGALRYGYAGWAPIKDASGAIVGTVETNIPFTEELLEGDPYRGGCGTGGVCTR